MDQKTPTLKKDQILVSVKATYKGEEYQLNFGNKYGARPYRKGDWEKVKGQVIEDFKKDVKQQSR